MKTFRHLFQPQKQNSWQKGKLNTWWGQQSAQILAIYWQSSWPSALLSLLIHIKEKKEKE